MSTVSCRKARACDTSPGSPGSPICRDCCCGPLHFLVLTVAAIVFIIGTILLARAWFHRVTTEIAVTDRRIIYKRGFVRRYTVEMHMDKVESVDVDQSILGRLLDCGDVIIHGTGMGIEPLPNIDHPLELRNHITAV